MYNCVRGTKDVTGSQASLWYWLLHKLRTQLFFYSFEEITVPILGEVGLFAKSLGATVDAVEKELFLVRSRHQEEISHAIEGIALRPEATAAIFRAFLAQRPLRIPWKVFTVGPMFRYERPQKGRLREFWQCSIECIGGKSVFYDIECLTLLDSLFRSTLLLPFFDLTINFLGNKEERALYVKALGNFCESQERHLSPEFTVALQRNPLRAFDKKTTADIPIIAEHAPRIINFFEDESSLAWETIKATLQKKNIPFIEDNFLVRGLDYYSGLVFEFSSPVLGAQSTFCGGGRYDGLAETLGGKELVPAVGAGIGIERLMIALESNGTTAPTLPRIAIITTSAQYFERAMILQESLSCPSEIYFDRITLRTALKKAERDSIPLVAIIGEIEYQNNAILVKDMQTGEQTLLSFNNAVTRIKNIFESYQKK